MRYLLVAFFFIFVFIVPGLLSLMIESLPNNVQPPLNSTKKVYNGEEMLQEVIVKSENISAIGVSLKNPNYEEKGDVVLKVSDENGANIRDSVISGKFIKDGGFVKFKFTPINNTMNKKIYFSISNNSIQSQNNIEVYLTDNPIQDGALRINKKYTEGKGISYVTYSRVDNRIANLVNMYINWWSKFISDPAFAILYVLFLCGLVYYLFRGE